jgi:hypothetical protein
MAGDANKVMTKMLERLFASMVNGPSLNCRPHSSRQRIDVTQMEKLRDCTAGDLLISLLGPERRAKVVAKVPPPPPRGALSTVPFKLGLSDTEPQEEELSEEERAARRAWSDQESVFTKLRVIVEDAKTYEQDTGAHVLNIGFPLLSLPPNSLGSAGVSRRIIAPIAFIPVVVTVKHGTRREIEIRCRGEGADLVIPNVALLAFLEKQSGEEAVELFADDKGEAPWRELRELVARVAMLVKAEVSPSILVNGTAGPGAPTAAPGDAVAEISPPAGSLQLVAAPRTEDLDAKPSVLFAAVLGLFPLANQGLLRDTQAMLDVAALAGPVESFVRLDATLEVKPPSDTEDAPAVSVDKRPRVFAEERLVTEADPCQAKAVRLARSSKGLVIHGPPGTGKSQTITNIIGDHIARGQRVLVVCDKRTALDVVANRLEHMGLGDLCALVHDPQVDQRELYKGARQQLDDLADATSDAGAERQLERVDSELQRLHAELTTYNDALTKPDDRTRKSFHELVGRWLANFGADAAAIDPKLLAPITLDVLHSREHDVQDLLERAAKVGYPTNPWRGAAGIDLRALLARPMDEFREAMSRCVAAATTADQTAHPAIPPFAGDVELEIQGRARAVLAQELVTLSGEVEPSVLAIWAGRSVQQAQEAQQRLTDAARHRDVAKSAPLDPELRQKLTAVLPPAGEITRSWKVLSDYVDSFGHWAKRFGDVRRKAPAAATQTIAYWLARDPQSAIRAKKKLDDMKSLAEAVEAGGVDRQMLLQFKREPFDVRQLIQWLGTLNQYIESAAKWYAVLNSAPKKQAAPIALFFGVALSPATAGEMREFLTKLRVRLELKADLEDGILKEPLPPVPTDDELMMAYSDHRNVLAAVTALPVASQSTDKAAPLRTDPALAPADVEAVHGLMSAQMEGAAKILSPYGLAISAADATRLKKFLNGLNSRIFLQQLHDHLTGAVTADGLLGDAVLDRSLSDHHAAVTFVLKCQADPSLTCLAARIKGALADPKLVPTLADGLLRSPARAKAIQELLTAFTATGLFGAPWLGAARDQLLKGEQAQPQGEALAQHLGDVEGVVRVTSGVANLPSPLRDAVTAMIRQSVQAVDGLGELNKAALAAEIALRLRTDPHLQDVDGQRLKTCFDRYRTLDRQKKEQVRDVIRHRWLRVQKQRLLSANGGRLNSLGADVRRRLTLRGERAMRLRQVIAMGRKIEGGDPLFDLRPVWMASPETVAQLFPREPIFDVVIFDEASQCRLEEALPVLTRAARVVIAGDPKQLPPTRFFESAVAVSEDDGIETADQLFESQQGEIEDLLSAALNLEIDECYLDVHYRSKNSDLIQFSNEHFYKSRLQAIPGHPSGRQPVAPLKLHRADGIYEKRCNAVEAQKVCEIVRDLLKRPQPPSIGIACFNLAQRDLIVDKLDELAETDEEFGRLLGTARERQGAGSFEGLFVKNLENVQGDERDHLIISTTYGPNAEGKFYKRFGPLTRTGGGRRLNVLVTRAREEVHVVTSIPQHEYRNLPPVPKGQTPTGTWLLFAYLGDAERMAQEYELAYRVLSQTEVDKTARVEVRQHPDPFQPSPLAQSLARRLATDRNLGSDVNWGNDGFCIDLALHHPARAEDVTIGVLCDMSRFTLAEDAVEWDVFRTGVLESQGWCLHRVWSPHFFRDASGGVEAISRDVQAFLTSGDKGEGLSVAARNPG